METGLSSDNFLITVKIGKHEKDCENGIGFSNVDFGRPCGGRLPSQAKASSI